MTSENKGLDVAGLSSLVGSMSPEQLEAMAGLAKENSESRKGHGEVKMNWIVNMMICRKEMAPYHCCPLS